MPSIRVSAFCSALCLCLVSWGQEVSVYDLRPDSTVLYRFDLRDRTVVHGRVEAVGPDSVMVRTANAGTRGVRKAYIRKVVRLDREGLPNSLYRFPNPIPSRHLVAGSAIPLKAGELYIQNTYLFLHSFSVGITDNLSAGAGLEPVSVLLGEPIGFITLKGAGKVGDNLHLGGTATFITFPTEDWGRWRGAQRNTGLATAMVTYGDTDSQVTGGVGWTYDEDGLAQRAVVTLAAQFRVSRRLALLTENWSLPVYGGNAVLYSYGVRIMGSRIAADVALVNNKEVARVIAIGFPFASFSVRF